MQRTQFSIIVPGYLIAVISSALCATLLIGIAGYSTYEHLDYLPIILFSIFLMIGFFIFVTAAPGFFFTVYLASKHDSHFISVYIIGGAINALLGYSVMTTLTGGNFTNLDALPLISAFAGAFGGWAYYKFRKVILNMKGIA